MYSVIGDLRELRTSQSNLQLHTENLTKIQSKNNEKKEVVETDERFL